MDGERGGGAQIVGQVFGEGLEGGFAGVVGRVARRVGDALLGAREDDGARSETARSGGAAGRWRGR